MNNFKVKRYGQFLGIFALFTQFVPIIRAAILDVGASITCGIQSDDTLNCIGWPLEMTSGRGQKIKDIPPPFSQISVGYTQICAIRSNDASLICNVSDKVFQRKGSFSQVSVATFHSCGLHTDGSVECWKEDRDAHDDGQTTPPEGSFSQVSVGRWHTCAIKTDQSVACWGNNHYKQIVSPNETFSQISAAKMGWHTCGIKTTDQSVVCWGLNDHGQATPPSGPFSQVSAGKWYTCGIRADDQSIACWGGNQDGQADPPSGRFSYVSAGMYHTCAIQADNHTPVCWGYNMQGSVKEVSGNSLPLKRID